MDKSVLYHLWRRLVGLHYGVFLVPVLVFGITAVVSLRSNNQQMIVLREKVFQADMNNTDVETPLRELRSFVYSHMNTNLSSGNNPVKPPIQLKYRFERLVAAEAERVQKVNGTLYNDAQVYCERLLPGSFYGGPRVQCIKDYVDARTVKPTKIADDVYKFDFLSPAWSPDAAGLSLAAMVLFLGLFIVSAMSDRLLRYELRQQ